jgi:hypothetical protein
MRRPLCARVTGRHGFVVTQSGLRQADGTLAARAVFTPTQSAWAWARQWEFWLALALATFLRFWRIDLTQYLFDQNGLFSVARMSATHGLIPLTGIPFSIRTLTPPWSEYSLLPFAALTANPLAAVIGTAIVNTLGVALCYVFTLRYFGRRIAAVSTLLFATCGAAINYSRFIWQPNDVAPLAMLWVLTLYLGCVEGRRWFAGNVALLALAAMFHPSAALLAPVTLVGAALAPRVPRLRAWIIAAVALLALALPMLIWEALSSFADLRSLGTFASGKSQFNLSVLRHLYYVLSGPVTGGGIPSVLDNGLNVLATLLFAVGWLALSVRMLRPARALAFRREAGVVPATRAWLLALFRGLRADAAWRINLLLWLSVTLPPALMVRHSVPIQTHYLLMLYPTAFIVSAMGAVVVIRGLVALIEQRAARLATVAALTLEAALLALIIARSAQWLAFPLSLTNAQTFNAYQDYGYPLSVLQGGADTLAQLQTQTGAAQVEVITPGNSRYHLAENGILVGERTDRLSLTPTCLALPAATARAWLIAPVTPGAPATALLGRLANAKQVGSLPMVGGPTYPVYQVSGATPALAGETALTPTVFADQRGDALRLVGASLPQPGALLLRWQVDAASAPTDQTRQFRVIASVNGATAYDDCDTQHWQAGETLFTWVPLHADGASDISVRVETTTNGLVEPTALGLRFLADTPINAPFIAATASAGPAEPLHAPVTANADGSLTIPARTLSPTP